MRFLIVRIAALGDIAMSTALLNRIRAEYPQARITWLCGERALPLVKLFPGLADVIAVDEHAILTGSFWARAAALAGLWRRLARHRFDRVLMLHPDPRYRLLILPLWGGGTRLDAASHGPGTVANPLPGRFRGDEHARLLDGPTWNGPAHRRYPLADIRSQLPPAEPRSSSRTRPRVVLVPGGARNVIRDNARRRWPVASYRLLAEELLKLGNEVVLIGDTHDVKFAAEFQSLAVRNVVGSLTLVQTLVELRDSDLVITHDTGPMHLARLVRTPIVALFGPTDPREFVGEDDSITTLWGGSHLACRPCYDGRDYPPCSNHVCMQSISVPEVLSAAVQRLALRDTAPDASSQPTIHISITAH